MKRRGFSIFETLLYLGLLTVILGVLMVFLLNILRNEAKVATMLEVDQNARFALEQMAATVRNAKTAVTPAVGESTASLSMTMADAAVSPTVFTVTNGVLTMKQGTDAAVPLTSSAVKVSALTFRNLLDPIANRATESTYVPCAPYPNKLLVCHYGGTSCINKNALPAHLGHGDTAGPCYVVTSAKSMIRIEMTVASPPTAGPGNEFQSTITLYDSATVPRQN